MSASADETVQRIVEAVGQAAFERVLPQIDSSTLRKSLQLIVERIPEGWQSRLFLPEYWAVYYHDGRRGFSSPSGGFLVFFADPRNDPRVAGGYPVRASEVRRLTAEEFDFGLHQNAIRARQGLRPYMFVVRSVGPAGAHPFFEEGMVDFVNEVDLIALDLFDRHIQAIIDEDGPARQTATFDLGPGN